MNEICYYYFTTFLFTPIFRDIIHTILKIYFIYSQPNQSDVHSLILCCIISDKILTMSPHIISAQPHCIFFILFKSLLP